MRACCASQCLSLLHPYFVSCLFMVACSRGVFSLFLRTFYHTSSQVSLLQLHFTINHRDGAAFDGIIDAQLLDTACILQVLLSNSRSHPPLFTSLFH